MTTAEKTAPTFKFSCPHCTKGYLRGGARFDTHVRLCKATAELKTKPPGDTTDKGQSIQEQLRARAAALRSMAADYVKKATRLDEMAEEVGRL